MQHGFESGLVHWEDIVPGEVVTFGDVTVTRDQIVEFARAFDPQPFHLDEAAAAETMVGRLFASGWHSCALLMRMLAEEVLNRSASLGSPGIEEVRWLKPVLPGDRLSARCTYLSKRRLASRPAVGVCQTVIEMLNQDDEVVMSWRSSQLLAVRSPGSAS